MAAPVGLIAAVVVAAILIFIPFTRRVLALIIRLAIFFAAVAVAAAGITMLMNDETIFEKPGFEQRVVRFVTMNSAAASSTGSGSVTCDMSNHPEAAPSAPAAPHKRGAKTKAAPEPQKTRDEVANASPAPLDDVYPELIRRGFPGIPRQKLFQLSQDTVNSLGGWKIVKSNPGAGTIDCIYTSRIFGLEDDVRITVEPSGEIDVCSRSGLARPGATSVLRYFPGDLGANIGHIKEFYEALEPKMDEVYKEEQQKENAKKPHQRSGAFDKMHAIRSSWILWRCGKLRSTHWRLIW
jgi:Protein of unknown function (DUF1499)